MGCLNKKKIEFLQQTGNKKTLRLYSFPKLNPNLVRLTAVCVATFWLICQGKHIAFLVASLSLSYICYEELLLFFAICMNLIHKL